jgi:hypothetical protein
MNEAMKRLIELVIVPALLERLTREQRSPKAA